ncbi:hypothetical protein GCM10027029_17760 [Conyzicola lurida]
MSGETRIAVAGDWHANRLWVQSVIPALHETAPDVRTILHAGDFGILPDKRGKGFLAAVDALCQEAHIERVLVTPGNHEDWPRLVNRFASRPGEAIRLSDRVWVLPRGFRFRVAGRSFMSFGGAASLDYAYRRARGTWWPEEIPTVDDVSSAIGSGPVEVLITHETIVGGTWRVETVLSTNPQGWDDDALEYSRTSRQLITALWNGVSPEVLFHGHLHVADRIELPTGQRVVSLGSDGQRKNIGLFDLVDLAWSWID